MVAIARRSWQAGEREQGGKGLNDQRWLNTHQHLLHIRATAPASHSAYAQLIAIGIVALLNGHGARPAISNVTDDAAHAGQILAVDEEGVLGGRQRVGVGSTPVEQRRLVSMTTAAV